MRTIRRPARMVLGALLMAGALPALAQEAVTATSGDPATIARIRAEVGAIDRDTAGYRRTTHDVFGFSLEGGELTGFFRGSEPRKLRARLFGETWDGTDTYYLSGGRPIFVHVVQRRYDERVGSAVRATIEHRYYFDGGRLIRRIRTQRPETEEDLSPYDPDLAALLRDGGLLAACAAAEGDEPPECTAPDGGAPPPPIDPTPLVEETRMDVSQSFQRIEAWLSRNAPEVRANLNPPATEAEIDEAERALGVRMPPSVRAAYLLHDGESESSLGLFDLWRWMPLDEVVEQNRMMVEIEEEYRFGDYRPGVMIPLMEDGGGNFLYVETSAGGAETPVIDWDHEMPTRDVKHPGFPAMLADFAGRLERGELERFRTRGLVGLAHEIEERD